MWMAPGPCRVDSGMVFLGVAPTALPPRNTSRFSRDPCVGNEPLQSVNRRVRDIRVMYEERIQRCQAAEVVESTICNRGMVEIEILEFRQ